LQLVENPCYFSGFIDNEKSMKGVGNFNKCYKLLYKLFNNEKKECLEDKCETNKKNQASVIQNYN